MPMRREIQEMSLDEKCHASRRNYFFNGSSARASSPFKKIIRASSALLYLIIENTLSLSSDQISKFKNVNEIECNPVEAFHLDSIKTDDDIMAFCNYLIRLKKESLSTVYIYTSPEELLKIKWLPTFN